MEHNEPSLHLPELRGDEACSACDQYMVGKIIAILTLLGLIYGGLSWVDGRYAKCADVQAVKDYNKSVERRLDYKIENDHLLGMRGQLYQLKQQHPTPASRTPVVDKEIYDLESTIPAQADKVKSLEAK